MVFNEMSNLIQTCSASGSSLAPVSAPVIGDEYVLVKKNKSSSDEKPPSIKNFDDVKSLSYEDLKLVKSALTKVGRPNVLGLGTLGYRNGGGRFGACSCVLTYDCSFTPSTSSTVQTVVALAPVQDTAFTSYWAHIFNSMRMRAAELQIDFTQFVSTVGHDVALSPVVVGYRPDACASTQYYADVSDYKTSRFAAYSASRPVVKYRVPSKWLSQLGWNSGQEASVIGSYLNDWAPTAYSAATLHKGFIHIASQKAMFDTERVVVMRLLMYMDLRGQV